MTQLNFDELAHFSERQLEAIDAIDDPQFKYILYGGALGGGKSYLLRWAAVRQLMYIANVYKIKAPVGMIATEDYPSLKDRQLQKIVTEFPSWLGKSHGDHKDYGRCYILNKKFGGGVIAFRNLDDTSKYQSAEFVFIFVDELTKNAYEIFSFLRSRLRCPGVPDYELIFMGATNPGGIGHGWCKALWIDRIFGDEWKEFEKRFKYIPSKATDNPYLDPAYYKVLDTLPESLRAAFRDGDWNIFVGQAFTEFNTNIHVIPDDTLIPAGAPCYCTFDWGFGRPFSVGWWFIDNDGRLIRFDEWYGWNGTPNVGIRMVDSDIARGIKARESEYQVNGVNRNFIRIGGSDLFQKRPDYKGGGQGKSTSEVFASPEFGLYFSPGDALRVLKIRQFRERLKVKKDGKPSIYVFERCKQFIRTIPNLIMDKTYEDIDTDGEDHVYDEVCFLCMARPLLPEQPTTEENEVTKRLKSLERQEEDSYDRFERDAYHDFSVFSD